MIRGIAAIVVLALVGAAAQPASGSAARGPTAARATAGTIGFTPLDPVAGQPGRFRLKVPTSGKRPVQLQKLVAGTWKQVATKTSTTTGVATFDITVPAKRTTFRGFAPRVASKNLGAVTTETLAVLPSLRGTVVEIGVGEDPHVSADGGEVVWSASQAGVNAAVFHRPGAGSPTVMSSPALSPVVSGDGASVLFSKGGQGFWDASWGLRRSNGTGEGSLVWEERADEEAPSTRFHPGGLSGDGAYASVVASPQQEDVEKLYLVRANGDRSLVSEVSGGTNDIAPDASCVGFDTHEALVPGDTNGKADAYVWIRSSNTFLLVSRLPNGDPSPKPSSDASMSEDCRYVVYEVNGRFNLLEVWMWDRTTDTRKLLSVGSRGFSEGQNYEATISADGSQVAFTSTAPLTSEKDDGGYDVYLWSRASNGLTLLTPKSSGIGAGLNPEISDDGRHVAFDGGPSNCESPCDRRIYLWSRTG